MVTERQIPEVDSAPRDVFIITAENTSVRYELAGVGTRTLALVFDLLIQLVLLITITLVNTQFASLGFGIDHLASFVQFIAIFCIIFGYNIFFEMVWGGRTPRKRLFGLRVIRDGGYPITFISSCIRNVLRIVDFGIWMTPSGGSAVLFGAPGLLFVFLSHQYKRIGDYAAGTVVIHELTSSPFTMPLSSGAPSVQVEAYVPLIKNLDRMTALDFRIVRRFTSRRSTLEPIVQAGVAESIARPLLERLDIRLNISYQTQYADFLEAVERVYAEENGLL